MSRLKPCGTTAAYTRHIRNRTIPCAACYAAHAAYQRERNAQVTRQRQVDRDIRKVIHILATELGVGRTQ